MKLSEFKQLIKQSILEEKEKETKNTGAMTPDEEEMVADYEREQDAKHALDKEEPLGEALNKDIKAFGQDLDKAFKAAGFDTLVLMQTPSAEQMNIARTTVQRIYNDGKLKLADALVNGKILKIEGVDYMLCNGLEKSCGCGGCLRHKFGNNSLNNNNKE